MRRNNNAPQKNLDEVPAEIVHDTLQSVVMGVMERKRPKNADELQQAINEYFMYCYNHNMRCGIELLCSWLHISRQTLLNWQNGKGCDKRTQEIIIQTKAMINSYIEQLFLKGEINPVCGIFALKNFAGWSDGEQFNAPTITTNINNDLSIATLPDLSQPQQTHVQGVGINDSLQTHVQGTYIDTDTLQTNEML